MFGALYFVIGGACEIGGIVNNADAALSPDQV